MENSDHRERPARVRGVECRDPAPQPVAHRVLGEVPEPASDDVPAGVAADRVDPDQRGVDQQDQRAEAHVAPLPVLVAEGDDRVEGQDHPEDHRDVPEPAVDVLQDQREPGLAGVALVRLGDGAGRRRQPERPVVGLAVVVAGQPEAQREDQDHQRRRQRPPRDRRAEVTGALDALRGQAGRVERRQVRLCVVVLSLEGAPGGVDDEGEEHHEGQPRLHPPPVPAQGLLLDPRPPATGESRRHQDARRSGAPGTSSALAPMGPPVRRRTCVTVPSLSRTRRIRKEARGQL